MVNLLSSLRAFVHRVLGLPMSDAPTLRYLLETHEGGNTFSVQDFEASFLRACTLDRRSDSDIVKRARISLAGARVSTIAFYKDKVRSEHEYIVVELVVPDVADSPTRDPEGSADSDVPVRVHKVGALLCERTVAPEHSNSSVQKGAIIHDLSPSSSSPNSSSPSSSSFSPIPAVDRFCVYDPPMEWRISGSHLVYKYTFEPHHSRPSIARVLAAASVLHDEAPDYLIRTRQCY
ncbi:hypothetical protein BV20DRAFT_424722 [Pilatotrama ljubarskyi]|nr:hypothetical protein BV20DRAFT_424722 [Pilatotrama ljubarskyi]